MSVYKQPIPENRPDMAPVRPEDGDQDAKVQVRSLPEFDERGP